MSSYEFECIKVSISAEGVAHVEINRPKALNAFSTQTWTEIGQCFGRFKTDGDVRSVVISAAGRMFTAGLDLKEASKGSLAQGGPANSNGAVDVARRGYYHRLHILTFQEAISAVENCDKPVVAVVHGACLGVGIDLTTACDIRMCTEDAYFMVKEVDIGMAADVGTLQRLPKVVGNDSWVREVCLTARKIPAHEAQAAGLVSHVLATKEAALEKAFGVAALIAEKSPVAVVSTKHLLNYSRDHSVREGLEYTAIWNALAHNSHDMATAIVSSLKKQKAQFPKL
ncbi:hypothetical protein IW140_001818 [Coemansia sp. RSA 1813]|nr:hypothetical protein EV178_002550 [Coemansia sp. RSA 1646]KAJ1772441.1 hypothetical protein LPJ74_001532 [Coemansia sp. RSA 1843]KAJ2091159.1 hypothetical protein IW138_002122 [Coemansia sp. RSA 986]KAJ2213585.1 hypothetical protein EV179_003700 [Coemansia sp. RSA 487]KAJ2571116.1 hypothetical protein IW140_001818 [Coemansia sp. RSA 1813]